MNKAINYYINRFHSLIRDVIEIKTNRIIVLRGVPDQIKDIIPSCFFADLQGFNKEYNGDAFNKDWFSKVFTELNIEKDYHVLSYSQFSYLIEYITPTFFNDRVEIIQDNLRKVFPLENSLFKQVNTTENIEERAKDLPTHHVEQLKINGNYYFVSKDLLINLNTTNAFTTTLAINYSSNKELEIIDITTDIYAIDLFVNQCLENDTFDKHVAIKYYEKQEINNSIIIALSNLNAFMSQFGGKVFLYLQTEINHEYVEQETTKQILNKYWGEGSTFRSLTIYSNPDVSHDTKDISQGKIVETIIDEYNNCKQGTQFRDLFLTAPTGAGKSLLFQLPAFYVSKQGDITIVVSPLIALMKDQVSAIRNDRGFEKVTYLNSELSLVDRERLIDQVKAGHIDILYMSPELLLSYDITHFIGERTIGLLVIDEAHLITTWGRDFRVDYWFLGNHIRKIRKYNGLKFPMVAVTATAIYGGSNDMVFDSIDSLVMQDPHIYIGVVKRNDIIFLVNNYDDFKKNYTKHKLDQTVNFIEHAEKFTSFKTLVYAPYTSHVRKINEALKAKGLDIATGYYGSLEKDLKEHAYQQFLNGIKHVMVSTKAFGMGIDIPDIQVVYHHAPSGVLPDYVQEIGRLARDPKLTGYAALNYSEKDKWFSKALHGMSALKPYQLKEVLRKINDYYKIHKSQNLLISVDDFVHIFDNSIDIDQKVLTALMMIEKDYLSKHRFNVLIARPKKLFVKVFGRVRKDEALKLIKKYRNSIQQIPYEPLENKGYQILSIDLDKIWITHFSNQSFPITKAKYYKNQLFDSLAPSLMPQLKISYILAKPFATVFSELENYFNKIKKAFSRVGNAYFTEQELIKALNNEFNSTHLATKVGKFILSNYSGAMLFNSKLDENAFLARRLADEECTYRLISNLHNREFSNLLNKFNALYKNNSTLEAYRYVTNKDSVSLVFSRLGYFLDLLGLGSFEIKGGENPMIFVRINDPQRIEHDSQSNYYNSLLQKTLDRHYLSNQIFDHFFMNSFTNEERWEFIEDFFLGIDIDDLIEKYPGSQAGSKVDIIEYLKEIANNQETEPKNEKKINLKLTFPPAADKFYGFDTLLTLKVNGLTKTMQVIQWLKEDPISFDKNVRQHQLNINKEVCKHLHFKLKQHPNYFTNTQSLNCEIEISGYNGKVKALIPYKDDPINFYKWWLKNPSAIKMSLKEQIELIDKVKINNSNILSNEHKRFHSTI